MVRTSNRAIMKVNICYFPNKRNINTEFAGYVIVGRYLIFQKDIDGEGGWVDVYNFKGKIKDVKGEIPFSPDHLPGPDEKPIFTVNLMSNYDLYGMGSNPPPRAYVSERVSIRHENTDLMNTFIDITKDNIEVKFFSLKLHVDFKPKKRTQDEATRIISEAYKSLGITADLPEITYNSRDREYSCTIDSYDMSAQKFGDLRTLFKGEWVYKNGVVRHDWSVGA